MKGLFIFVSGAFVGALVTAVIANKRYEEVCDKYDRYIDEACPDEYCTEEYKESLEESAATGEVKTRDRYHHIVRNYSKRETELDLAEKEFPREDDDENNYVAGEMLTRSSNEGRELEPYIISVDEYGEDMVHYDKLTYYYYEDDDTLTNENEEVVINVAEEVGEDALTSFGELSRDPEIVYVRNNKLEVDYEIIRLSKSYSKTILGYDNEEHSRSQKGHEHYE